MELNNFHNRFLQFFFTDVYELKFGTPSAELLVFGFVVKIIIIRYDAT